MAHSVLCQPRADCHRMFRMWTRNDNSLSSGTGKYRSLAVSEAHLVLQDISDLASPPEQLDAAVAECAGAVASCCRGLTPYWP